MKGGGHYGRMGLKRMNKKKEQCKERRKKMKVVNKLFYVFFPDFKITLWMKKFGYTPVGYVKEISINEDYEEIGLSCEFQHCIMHMPVRDPRKGSGCPVFDRKCPGGVMRADECRRLEDEHRRK